MERFHAVRFRNCPRRPGSRATARRPAASATLRTCTACGPASRPVLDSVITGLQGPVQCLRWCFGTETRSAGHAAADGLVMLSFPPSMSSAVAASLNSGLAAAAAALRSGGKVRCAPRCFARTARRELQARSCMSSARFVGSFFESARGVMTKKSPDLTYGDPIQQQTATESFFGA